MKGRRYIPLLLLVAITIIAAGYVAKMDPVDSPGEKALIDSVYSSMHCNCVSDSFYQAQPPGTFAEDGVLLVSKNGHIIMKGCFRNKQLTCGVKCEYDESWKLLSISKINQSADWSSVDEIIFAKDTAK